MIKKMTQLDIEKIAELYEQEMSKNFQNVGEKPINKEEYVKILRRNIKGNHMFVLKNQEILGFIWFSKEKDEINLEELFVTEKNKGYGKKLMIFLIDFAKKNKIKRINSDIHFNNNAINFFKKFGFSERTVELSLDLD